MNKCNRTWIAFANKYSCRHVDAINSLGFIAWRMGRARFAIGDIVYLFMSDERYVRFKMIVTVENCKREDKEFWIEKAPDDKTYKLELLAESNRSRLTESDLLIQMAIPIETKIVQYNFISVTHDNVK